MNQKSVTGFDRQHQIDTYPALLSVGVLTEGIEPIDFQNLYLNRNVAAGQATFDNRTRRSVGAAVDEVERLRLHEILLRGDTPRPPPEKPGKDLMKCCWP